VQKQVALTLTVAEDPPEVQGDPSMLEQMLENLIANAIKYTPAQGKVWVELTSRPGWLVVTVRDTGIGIPDDEQARLFQEFFRASNARKLVDAGTGLGLALVKRTVEIHGGRISAKSAIGQGSTFVVEMPTG
jgi:signal transduction histidine kinase